MVKGGRLKHNVEFPMGVGHRVENGWGLTKVAAGCSFVKWWSHMVKNDNYPKTTHEGGTKHTLGHLNSNQHKDKECFKMAYCGEICSSNGYKTTSVF